MFKTEAEARRYERRQSRQGTYEILKKENGPGFPSFTTWERSHIGPFPVRYSPRKIHLKGEKSAKKYLKPVMQL